MFDKTKAKFRTKFDDYTEPLREATTSVRVLVWLQAVTIGLLLVLAGAVATLAKKVHAWS